MQLVSRKVLFDIMAHRRPVTFGQVDEAESQAYQKFCKIAEDKYAEAMSQTSIQAIAMELFANHMLAFMKDNQNDVRFVGQGSSRIVFALADGTALKLAKTKAGIAQNCQEAKTCMDPDHKYAIFPDFYGADKKNWLSLNCECCARATEADFKKLIGVQPSVISSVIEFILYTHLQNWEWRKLVDHYLSIDNKVYATFAKWLMTEDNVQFQTLRSLLDFYRKHGTDELLLGDVEEVDNWGITVRDNKEVLVIIDAGFNADIFDRFYK